MSRENSMFSFKGDAPPFTARNDGLLQMSLKQLAHLSRSEYLILLRRMHNIINQMETPENRRALYIPAGYNTLDRLLQLCCGFFNQLSNFGRGYLLPIYAFPGQPRRRRVEIPSNLLDLYWSGRTFPDDVILVIL